MIEIDGSYAEGGGAILRQSLALSMHTGKPFHITGIRANRPKPGMSMQHLKALNTAQALCNAEVKGNFEGSTEVTFKPGDLKSKSMRVDIETAGSITLFLQSLILPCIFSLHKYKFEIIGGTDAKWSQPMDYFANVFLPQMRKFGKIDMELAKRGYYPKGGGILRLRIDGSGMPDEQVNLAENGNLLHIKGVSHASRDIEERQVSDRQAKTAELLLRGTGVPVNVRREYSNTLSSGSGITLWAIHGTEDGVDMSNPIILGADSLGEPRKKAEQVGEEAAESMKKILASGAACDHYLADQLVPFMAVAGGLIRTSEITNHVRSNIYVAEKFTDAKFTIKDGVITCKI